MSTEEREGEEKTLKERIMVISLSKPIYGRKVPRTRRTPRAVRYLKERIQRHMKVKTVIIDPSLNDILWARGIQKPPRKIEVKIVKDEKEDLVEVFPVE